MKILDYTFARPELLESALTHKSYHHENSNVSAGHNERLEFLGDAVLDLALSDELMRAYPDLDEGSLSKIRASLVNESVLGEIAKECGINGLLRLGRGEKSSKGDEKPRLLASAFEAVIGAIYLDGGFATALDFVKRLFGERIRTLELDVHYKSDYKTRLQEKAQAAYKRTPVYELLGQSGPDHDKIFSVQVKVGTKVLGKGTGKSKKQAEQDAARVALEELQ